MTKVDPVLLDYLKMEFEDSDWSVLSERLLESFSSKEASFWDGNVIWLRRGEGENEVIVSRNFEATPEQKISWEELFALIRDICMRGRRLV